MTRRLQRWELAALVAAWAAAEALAHAAGVTFDAGTLDTWWQLLPADVLRTRLLPGLWHLHAQPPLFNLAVGAALHLAPSHEAAALHVLFAGCGALTVVLTAALARALGAGRAAPLAGLLLLASPSLLLYEHHLGYEILVAPALAGAALLLARAVERASLLALFACFCATAAACLLRSLYPLPFLLAALALAMRALGVRRALFAAALPLCAVVGWQAKNAALFGTFASSSWAGMNLSRVTVDRLTPADRAALGLSAAALVGPFRPIERYPAALLASTPAVPDVPELRAAHKASGAPNYNHAGYLAVSRGLLGDAARVLRERPAAVARAVATAWLASFAPSSQWRFVWDNRRRLGAYASFWEQALCLQLPLPALVLGQTEVYLTLLVGIPLLLVLCARDALRAGRTDPAGAASGFCALAIATTLFVGNAAEVGENNRFHAAVAPLLVAALVAQVDRRARRR